jgi:hypothetical protein
LCFLHFTGTYPSGFWFDYLSLIPDHTQRQIKVFGLEKRSFVDEMSATIYESPFMISGSHPFVHQMLSHTILTDLRIYFFLSLPCEIAIRTSDLELIDRNRFILFCKMNQNENIPK